MKPKECHRMVCLMLRVQVFLPVSRETAHLKDSITDFRVSWGAHVLGREHTVVWVGM